jgi:hypothetical protein
VSAPEGAPSWKPAQQRLAETMNILVGWAMWFSGIGLGYWLGVQRHARHRRQMQEVLQRVVDSPIVWASNSTVLLDACDAIRGQRP